MPMMPSWQASVIYDLISAVSVAISSKVQMVQVFGLRLSTLTAYWTIILARCALMSLPLRFAFWMVSMVVMPYLYAKR